MAGKSDYLADKVLNHLFRTSTLTKPTNVYFALFSADPTDANITANELAIGTAGYSRVSVAVADAQWTTPAASGAVRVITNVSPIVWGIPSEPGWNGGNPVTHIGIYDAPTGGNLLYSGALGTPRTILGTDNAPTIAANAVQIQEF